MMSETKLIVKKPASHVNRVLFEHNANPEAPCLVVFCGIHGNEKAGLEAFHLLLPLLEEEKLSGSLYVLSGNIPALARGQRFIDEDLNRLWKRKSLEDGFLSENKISENKDRKELLRIINDISSTITGPLYFIDVHTTSAASIPFITIDDSLINRRFTSVFPVPVVLGIEEYLQGALLSYINQQGFVSLGFEAGEHHDECSVRNAESFLYMALCVAGVMKPNQDLIKTHRERLERNSGKDHSFYEVIYRFALGPGDDFKMCRGYENFQKVGEGALLAYYNGKELKAEEETTIFMPLYQKQGEDGFFFVRRIPSWILGVSAGLRLLRLDALLALLPGISWIDPEKNGLRVNLKTVRFLAKPLFHLLGYREIEEDQYHLLIYNRERASQKERYPFKYPKL
ncbi:aspartoacylase [Robertkochia marina]|uniref:Aspartoacylase n=1 Tax=Robertkochia marina TaxID=1227945 RepID=A0A4S3LYJ4_9FLAO|nr:succinylglutamate desuccinylase/aspartoacylase family protein [Robertkochia marina]THD66365.1 aspartoacylase [Robertkochia marina]TRZ44045.1 aspartoacylase [Robertkochia marina]